MIKRVHTKYIISLKVIGKGFPICFPCFQSLPQGKSGKSHRKKNPMNCRLNPMNPYRKKNL